jgi:hypothetical protein
MSRAGIDASRFGIMHTLYFKRSHKEGFAQTLCPKDARLVFGDISHHLVAALLSLLGSCRVDSVLARKQRKESLPAAKETIIRSIKGGLERCKR